LKLTLTGIRTRWRYRNIDVYFMGNQSQLNEECLRLLDKFKQSMPDFAKAEFDMLDVVYKDG